MVFKELSMLFDTIIVQDIEQFRVCESSVLMNYMTFYSKEFKVYDRILIFFLISASNSNDDLVAEIILSVLVILIADSLSKPIFTLPFLILYTLLLSLQLIIFLQFHLIWLYIDFGYILVPLFYHFWILCYLYQLLLKGRCSPVIFVGTITYCQTSFLNYGFCYFIN